MAARINEQRQAASLSDMADESVPIAGGVALYAQGVEWINHAVAVGFDTDISDADMCMFQAFYNERSLVPKLEITTFTPASFLARLAARCFVIEHFESVLTCSIHPRHDPFACIEHSLPHGLTITRLDKADETACREFATIVLRGFLADPIPEPQIAMSIRSLRHPRTVSFFACIDSEPAGAASMEIFEHAEGRACALWGTTVLEPFRRRGLQQALLAHRLCVAQEQGCTLAFIESKPGIPTERNAARLGFSLAYTRVSLKQHRA